MRHVPYETRSAPPIEVHDDDGGNPIVAATQAVEELRTAVEQHRTATDQRIATELRSITERLDAIDVRTQRPGGTAERPNAEAELQRRAFTGFLRYGPERLAADEARSLIVGDDTRGGYLAPPEFVAEVVKGIVEVSPVRQAARVGNTSSGSVILPKRTGRPTAVWVGEEEDRPETASTYGRVEIPVHEMACYVDVSLRLLEDAAVNVDAEVSADLSQEFGRLEGSAFISGDGVKKPLGFMVDSGVTYFANGHASALQADALIGLVYSLPAYYRNRGAWMMNGGTLTIVRKLKDGQNNYLWQPSYQAGQPETLLGRPVIEAIDMDDVGANKFPIAFGDFSSAFRIYDRVSLSVMRDPYSVATKGLVRFHARRRVGGGVVLGEAIKTLKIATS
jgi:HK97 family phage major capsid protein